METQDYINKDIENVYKTLYEIASSGDSQTRIDEEKRMFNFINDYCSREGYDELIVTIRNLRDGTTDNVILEYDHNNDTWIWSYDWDEGQEFQFIGITPISEVEPMYRADGKYEIKLTDSMWVLAEVQNIMALPISVCNKCGFKTITRSAYCPDCGRYMVNSGKPRRKEVK